MMRLVAVAGNSCLTIRFWMVSLTVFWLLAVRSFSTLAWKEVSESCRKASSLYNLDCQATTAPPLSADLMTMSCRLLRFLRANHSSEERLENLVWQLNLSFWMSWRHLLMKKSKEASWPSGGVHFDLRTWSVSEISLSEALELSSLSWEKAFNWMQQRNF